MTKDGCSESESLKSNHEEANTRMCVHARVVAENGADHIVISSPDMDVLMLLNCITGQRSVQVRYSSSQAEKESMLT